MDGWRRVLWCSTTQTLVTKVGWSIERFGGQAIWQACSRSGKPVVWSWCAQKIPACSVHLHFLSAAYTHGFHEKIVCFSICEFVDASCKVFGLQAWNGGGLPCVDWCAPCEHSVVGATVSFSSVEGHCSVPVEVGEFKHATSERASWMSNLRSFLRLGVSRFMTLVRPRDYGSLTGGMVDDPLWRHALYGVMHRQSGPSLLCAVSGQRWDWLLVRVCAGRLLLRGLCSSLFSPRYCRRMCDP